MEEKKNRIEALLFASGRRMDVDEICNICKVRREDALNALNDLKKKYEDSKTLTLVNDGEYWKLTVRKDYMELVQGIVTKTELSKGLMETLAVIAFKYPIKQSDVIKIRTNKAYDHLKELEGLGYITRQKYGRTKLIKLAQKFFDYFDLPEDKLRETFKDFDTLAKAIEEKESIIDKMKKAKPKEKTEVIEDPEVDLVGEKGEKVKLEVVNTDPDVYEEEKEVPVQVLQEKEKVGTLDVVDVPEKEEKEIEEKGEVKEEEAIPEEPPEDEDSADYMEQLQEKKVKTEIEKEIDKRVDELIHPIEDKEDDEDVEEEVKEMIEDQEGEPQDLIEASQEGENKDQNLNNKKDDNQ